MPIPTSNTTFEKRKACPWWTVPGEVWTLMTNPDLLTSLRPVPVGIQSGPFQEGVPQRTLFRDPHYCRPQRGNDGSRPPVEFVSGGLLEQGPAPHGQGESPGDDPYAERDERG